jgi:aminoglycoside phosphotransferase (APT) family kinase protein
MHSDLDVAALDEWIGDRLPGYGAPLRVTRMGRGTGEANALYWLRRGEHVWVLRRPPAVINAPGASDMNREWRILVALDGTSVPHPAPLLLGGTDGPVGGADGPVGGAFLIMARVDGFTPVGVLPAPYDNPAGRRDLGFALVDALADLAAVPWRERGLDGLGRPEGFLDRQVPRWLRQLDGYRTRDIPGLDRMAGWLEANRPPAQRPTLMHGDYSPYNVMAAPRDPRRLAAVIDWDTGTIGDPLLDIGHLLARWTEPGEEPATGVWDIEVRDGLPTRAELAARYAERTGADLSALPYYQALALFKLAIILEGSVARLGAARAAMVDRLVHYAELSAKEAR